MTANHLILGDRDFVHRSGVTVTASSAVAGMPAANILDFRPGVRWRAATATAETITVDFGETVDIDTFAVVGHNGSLDATVEAEIAEDGDAAFAAPVYTSPAAVELWPPVYGLGEGGFGKYFGGYVDPEELGVFVALAVERLGAVYSGRYLRLTFNDPSSAIGAFEAGVLMAGGATVLERDVAFGYELDEVDPSDQRRTDGGGMIVTARAITPRMRVTFPALSRSEALTVIPTLKRQVGRQRPILVSVDPAGSASTFYRSTIFGLVSSYTPTRFRAPDRAEVSMTIDGLV